MDARDRSHSRRSLLTAFAAAGSALATHAILKPDPASAASVELGATSTAATATVIRTVEASVSARALVGLVTTTTLGGATVGVWGQSNALHGNGVFGIAPSGNSKGVFGRSVDGSGVFGQATGTSTANRGVYGESKSSNGVGLYGAATVGNGVGIFGTGHVGVQVSGKAFGVLANATGTGIYGAATAQNGTAVYATAIGSGGTGVFGNASGSSSIGVHGQGNFGLVGSGSSVGLVVSGGFRGIQCDGGALLSGGADVVGNLSVSGTKQFLIDHPQDPANRTLAHSCVEAPEMLNVYGGTTMLDPRGRATIRLPRYFGALNRDYRYQLTPVGGPAPELHVAREVDRDRFVIAGGRPGQKVCWIVTGIRHDAWARAHPMRSERPKRKRDRGRYLHPELFGAPKSAAIDPAPRIRAPRLPRRRPGIRA
jgi:hypothetical protein